MIKGMNKHISPPKEDEKLFSLSKVIFHSFGSRVLRGKLYKVNEMILPDV